MNEIRKVTLGMVEMLLDRIKDETFLHSTDFLQLFTTDFNIEVFDKIQEIKIEESYLFALEEEFKKEASSKWISDNAYVVFTLQKHTHFTTTEVKLLQEEFRKFLEGNNEGIGKEHFRELIFQIYQSDPEEQTYLKTLDFEKMFEIFDIDDTGTLDFK